MIDWIQSKAGAELLVFNPYTWDGDFRPENVSVTVSGAARSAAAQTTNQTTVGVNEGVSAAVGKRSERTNEHQLPTQPPKTTNPTNSLTRSVEWFLLFLTFFEKQFICFSINLELD